MTVDGVNPAATPGDGTTRGSADAARRDPAAWAAANYTPDAGGFEIFNLGQPARPAPVGEGTEAPGWRPPASAPLADFLGVTFGGSTGGPASPAPTPPPSSHHDHPPAPPLPPGSSGSGAVAGGPVAPMPVPAPVAGANAGAAAAGGPRRVRNVGTALRGMNKPIVASIGSASFSLPPVSRSNRSVKAPKVSWGKGWVRNGDHMVHSNGTRAYVKPQPRVSIGDPSKARTVETPHGRGRRLADGTVVGIDRQGRPFALDKAGNKKALGFGVYTIGGQKVRVFEATTVNVVTPDKRFMRYDSRGNVRMGRNGQFGVIGGGPTGVQPQQAIAAATQATSASGGGSAKGGNPGQGAGGPPPVGSTPPGGGPGQVGQITPESLTQLLALVRSLIGRLEEGRMGDQELCDMPMQHPSGGGPSGGIGQLFGGLGLLGPLTGMGTGGPHGTPFGGPFDGLFGGLGGGPEPGL